jgi:hypothetical protein
MSSPSVVISFCANDIPFIDKTLSECKKFCDDVIVVYGSRMYDGGDADLALVGMLSERHETVQFCMYDVDLSQTLNPRGREGVQKRPLAYWHNLARWTGICRCTNDWILLLDGDEVPDGAKVKRWLQVEKDPDTIYKAANFWYFKLAENQATTLEDSVLLVHKCHLTRGNVFGDMERDHIHASSGAKLERLVKDPEGNVMFHHFSWVRGKEGLKRKLRSFAHSQDMFKNVDIDVLVDYIYRNDDVNDVIHNYTYVHVDSFLQ